MVSETAPRTFDANDVFFKRRCCTYSRMQMIQFLQAESLHELQGALHGIGLRSTSFYCCAYNLENGINTEKTKSMIFSKGKTRNIPHFVYNNRAIQVVSSFRYLGIDLNYNGNFSSVKNTCTSKHRTAFSLLRKSKKRKRGLPTDPHLQMFDQDILPILLYGAEIWGLENNHILEKLHLRFCRILLMVNNSTPNGPDLW